MDQNQEPAYDELADEDDELSWSWDELTNSKRTTISDKEAAAYALFAGVPADQVESVKKQYEELFE